MVARSSKTAGKERTAATPARADRIEPIDLHVGAMIRAARTMRQMTRLDLALRIGVGQEAVEKYERGESRVLASRLWSIAQVLEVPVASFFEQFNPQGPTEGAEDMAKAMTRGNMGIALDLQRLTYDQRQMVRKMIDTLIAQNEQQAVGTAG